MNFSPFRAISFDCYGTLIDWESGILPIFRAILSSHGQSLTDAAVLELYAEFEAEAEKDPYQNYRDVLRSVVRAFAARLHFVATPAEINSLHESVAEWQPFPDTVKALHRLQTRYRLAVISNIDNDLFAATRRHLDVEFEVVMTAEKARSYKPALNNFRLARRELGLGPCEWLHVGQSLYHDVAPARALGIASVWVNRKSARPGIGAVPKSEVRPDLEVQDLAALAEAAAQRCGSL
jgi:2-haloacid dehalogenase